MSAVLAVLVIVVVFGGTGLGAKHLPRATWGVWAAIGTVDRQNKRTGEQEDAGADANHARRPGVIGLHTYAGG